MEFYVKLKRFCKLQKRFNSQRDGILPILETNTNDYKDSFNSQRDGILRWWKNYFHRAKIVPIPNGMEFYIRLRPTRTMLIGVSIPNGMEFYVFDASFTFVFSWFQFPMGWNSTKQKPQTEKFYTVSIPNGMEFYDSAKTDKEKEEEFQFPTGWNSTPSVLSRTSNS